MPRSPEQRAAANRENSRRSTGPTSEEGKKRSAKNAFKHGMRAVTPMPGEDPALLAAREQKWHDYYRPGSPAAEHLVKQCVRATVMADHCQTYHDAVVARQVREAGERWDNARRDEVAALVARLSTDPVAASAGLRRTADGCAYLADRWAELVRVLQESGYWTAAQALEASHLQGFWTRMDKLRGYPGAWLTLFYSAGCRPGDPQKAVETLYDPYMMPEEFARPEANFGLPEPADCRELLLEMAEREHELMSLESRRLARAIDGPARESAVSQACMPAESPQTRLYLRYQAESRLAFHRAYDSLTKTLKQDAEHAASQEDEREPEAQHDDAPAPVAAQSPETSTSGDTETGPKTRAKRGRPGRRRDRPPAPERSHLEKDSPRSNGIEVMEDRGTGQGVPAGAGP